MHEPTLDERIEALRKRIEGIAGYDSDPLGQEAIEALAIIALLKAENEKLFSAYWKEKIP